MQKEMKMEGDVLKVSVSEGIDSDKDGVQSIKAAIQLELDGSEIIDELLKSSSLAEKAKGILVKLGIVKE